MSFQINGQLFTPDYKAKEKRLYQVIASRDDEIALLRKQIEGRDMDMAAIIEDSDRIREELRALKAKERRRATKRKKVADEA
jgi:hypothetical protein